MQRPDEVPGVVLPVPRHHAARAHHPVPHPLQTVQNLGNIEIYKRVAAAAYKVELQTKVIRRYMKISQTQVVRHLRHY